MSPKATAAKKSSVKQPTPVLNVPLPKDHLSVNNKLQLLNLPLPSIHLLSNNKPQLLILIQSNHIHCLRP